MSKILNRIVLYLSFLILFNVFNYAQTTVNVTLPDVSGTPGDQILVPINVSDLTGKNAKSYQFQVDYDNTIIYITGVTRTGTLTPSNPQVVNADTLGSKIRVAYLSTSALNGSGVLIYLNVKLIGVGISPLSFGITSDTEFRFQSGGPTAITTNGSVASGVTNFPPEFDPVDDKTVTEGDLLTFTVNATDPENNSLTYSTGTLPNGAEFNPTTRTFSWIPNSNQEGEYTIEFIVNDGTNSTSLFVDVTVNNVNNIPELSANILSPVNVDEGQSLEIQFMVTDVDVNDTHTFSAVGLPDGATINDVSGLFSWTPTFSQSGQHQIIFIVTDNNSSSDTLIYQINVANINQAPVFGIVMPDTTVQIHNVPVTFSFTYTAIDSDNDAITFFRQTGPDGSTISSSGVFTWTPNASDQGMEYAVVIIISDGFFIAQDIAVVRGSDTILGLESDNSQLPNDYSLLQNFPNPFNPTTNIRFTLPKESFVKLRVFNMLGEEVRLLVNQTLPAGIHSYDFDASNLSSGTYIYRIEADPSTSSGEGFVSMKKMLLVK